MNSDFVQKKFFWTFGDLKIWHSHQQGNFALMASYMLWGASGGDKKLMT